MKNFIKSVVIALCVFAIPVCSSFHLSASYEQEIEFTEESIERLDYCRSSNYLQLNRHFIYS